MFLITSFLQSLFGHHKKQPLNPTPNLGQVPLEPAAKRLVLRELQNLLEHQHQSSDTLDSKLKELLSSVSLILALITTLQVTTGIAQIGWYYWIGLVLVLVLYISLVIVILRGLRPMKFHTPIPDNWDEIEERFFDLDEDATLDLLIVNYLEYGKENKIPLDYKAKKVRQASFLLASIVIVLVLMGLLCFTANLPSPWQSPLITPASTTIPTSTP